MISAAFDTRTTFRIHNRYAQNSTKTSFDSCEEIDDGELALNSFAIQRLESSRKER